jgi:plastocyanin
LLGIAWLGALGCTAYAARLESHPAAAYAKAQNQEQAAPVQVKIDNFRFEPQEITVAPGTTVVWTNRDDVPHTVTSIEDKFHSKALDTDDAFSFTFKDPGTYEYYCTLHSKMTGKVIVK